MATTTIDNATTTLGAAAATPAFERTDERVRRAFEAEELHGLKIGTWVRLVVIFTVAVWLPLVTPLQVLWYYYLLMIGFVALSVAPYEIKRRILASVWASYVFTFLDIALLAFAIMVPNPMTHELALPAGLQLHFDNELYFHIFIGAALFSYSAGVVLWSGISAAALYALGVWWLAVQPGSFVDFVNYASTSRLDLQISLLEDFNRINLSRAIQTSILFLTVAGVLAVSLWRVRKLVYKSAIMERARANLARYFSPNIVDELATADELLRAGRRPRTADHRRSYLRGIENSARPDRAGRTVDPQRGGQPIDQSRPTFMRSAIESRRWWKNTEPLA